MPKFMFKVFYEGSGAKGVLAEGGSGRRAVVQKTVKGLGGKVDAFYFAYGNEDAYVIADLPDATAALAVSLAVNASGTSKLTTIPLITAEELDAACKVTTAYRAPGTK
jgi:uncharacterized protein with GYD domain